VSRNAGAYNDPWTKGNGSAVSASAIRIRTARIYEYAAASMATNQSTDFVAAHSGASVVRVMGRLCSRPSLASIRSSKRSKQIEGALKYLRPRTDTPKLTIRSRRLASWRSYSVRGAGGYQMARYYTGAKLRSPHRSSLLQGLLAVFKPGDMVKFKAPLPARNTERDVKAVEARKFNLTFRPGHFLIERFSQRSGRLQTGPWWRRSMAIEVIKPGLATTRPGLPVGPATIMSAFRSRGALDQYALRVGNLLVGNDRRAPPSWKQACWRRSLSFAHPPLSAITGDEGVRRRSVNGEARPRSESFAGQGGRPAHLRFHENRCTLYVAVAGGIEVPAVSSASRSTYGLRSAGRLFIRAVRLRLAMCLPVGQPALGCAQPAASSRAN